MKRSLQMVLEQGLHACVPMASPAPGVTTLDRNYARNYGSHFNRNYGWISPKRNDVGDGIRGDKARVYRWRAANLERYNACMRKWRKERAAEVGKEVRN